MKKLDISITKAQITAFKVIFDDESTPQVSATIALLTDHNKHVTDFEISTHAWSEDKKFILPFEMISPIKKMAGALEHVIIEHVREGQLKLTDAVPFLESIQRQSCL